MAIKTPSFGIDQNQDGPFIDKYIGRIPMYLKRIPETINDGDGYVVVCNPEYIQLVKDFEDGIIDRDNMSIELYNEVTEVIDLIPSYGLVPMPDYDAFFKCLGEVPATGGCPLLITKDSQFGCAVFYTSCGNPFIVKPPVGG